jgi:hypothetical protein
MAGAALETTGELFARGVCMNVWVGLTSLALRSLRCAPAHTDVAVACIVSDQSQLKAGASSDNVVCRQDVVNEFVHTCAEITPILLGRSELGKQGNAGFA